MQTHTIILGQMRLMTLTTLHINAAYCCVVGPHPFRSCVFIWMCTLALRLPACQGALMHSQLISVNNKRKSVSLSPVRFWCKSYCQKTVPIPNIYWLGWDGDWGRTGGAGNDCLNLIFRVSHMFTRDFTNTDEKIWKWLLYYVKNHFNRKSVEVQPCHPSWNNVKWILFENYTVIRMLYM